MARYFVGPLICCVVLMSLWGCASLWPQKKPTVNAPIIMEEDVPEKPAAGQENSPAVQNPSGTETVPPGLENQPTTQTDSESKPPRRRFKFRDRGGWESIPDRPDTKQP